MKERPILFSTPMVLNAPERFYPTRVCNMRWGVGGTWQIQVNGQWIDTTAGFHKVEDNSFWKYCSIDTVSAGVSRWRSVTGNITVDPQGRMTTYTNSWTIPDLW